MHEQGRNNPLLLWMDEGDPDLVPVMMGSASDTAAAYFGVPSRADESSESGAAGAPPSPEMILRCRQETGIQIHWPLGEGSTLQLVEFMEDVERKVTRQVDSCGTLRIRTTLVTPKGNLSETFIIPRELPACWEENFVKGQEDLPALAYLSNTAARLALEDSRVRDTLCARFRAEASLWPADVPLFLGIGIPTFDLMSQRYMSHACGVYLLTDHRALFESVFESEARSKPMWIECAAAAGADYVMGAINGLELFSPGIYRRYFIPQARALHELAHTHGLRGWVHTCGHMKRLIAEGVYEPMAVDILESLSHPPLGDVSDLREARSRLGSTIVTRGAVNVSTLYAKDPEEVRQRVRAVLRDTRGYRHMVGDTNSSYPPYPRENLLAMVDEVRKSGRMFCPEETG